MVILVLSIERQMREEVRICQVLFVESSELEPEKAAKCGFQAGRKAAAGAAAPGQAEA